MTWISDDEEKISPNFCHHCRNGVSGRPSVRNHVASIEDRQQEKNHFKKSWSTFERS